MSKGILQNIIDNEWKKKTVLSNNTTDLLHSALASSPLSEMQAAAEMQQ